MLARDVLDAKGRRLVAIDSEALVNEAIAKLVQNNIGSLPVVDANGLLVGVFSERDVLRLIHHRGDGFGRLPVSEVMTRDAKTVAALIEAGWSVLVLWQCQTKDGKVLENALKRFLKRPVRKNPIAPRGANH